MSSRSLRIFAFIAIALLLLRLGNRYVFRSLEHNQRVAGRARQLSAQVRADPNDPLPLRELAASAESWYGFERCYSLGEFGELGPLAKPAMPTLIAGLRSGDAFVRDTAAHARKMGTAARGSEGELVELVRNHVSESAAMYAIEALGGIGTRSPQVIDCLRFAVNARDSFAAQAARTILTEWDAFP
jgi:hypothetical protein